MRNELDKFYTNDKDVKTCLKNINLEKYDLIIEPSAGNGSFSNKINHCLAYDLEPENEKIIQQNFLTLTKEKIPSYNNLCFIGNPPFGKRGILAKQFLSHCLTFNPSTIAFILPKTFIKENNQKMFNDEWVLSKIVELDNNYTMTNQNIYIPCYFFVWNSKNFTNDTTDLRTKKAPANNVFSFVPRKSEDADLVINGNNGKVREIKDVTNFKAEHYIKISEGYDKDVVKERLNSLQYNFVSSVNGGVAWINRNDIFQAWHDKYDNNN